MHGERLPLYILLGIAGVTIFNILLFKDVPHGISEVVPSLVYVESSETSDELEVRYWNLFSGNNSKNNYRNS